MKALITGSEGFVGRYLRAELEANGYEVFGLDRIPGEKVFSCDLEDAPALEKVLAEVMPDSVFHLAGQADVGRSWREPAATFRINTVGAVNLLECVRKICPGAGILLVGSSDEYGVLGDKGENVREDMPVQPRSPYAVSKKAQEDVGMLYANVYGMRVMATRSFNHGGAGQREGFLLPDFAAGIVRVENGEWEDMPVGNLDAKRDFTHVKDVVRAYRLLLEKGESGEVYNVGSGQVRQVREILEQLIALSGTRVNVRTDPARNRPSDTPVIRCDNTKLVRATGWQPEYGIRDILTDVLEDFRKRMKK